MRKARARVVLRSGCRQGVDLMSFLTEQRNTQRCRLDIILPFTRHELYRMTEEMLVRFPRVYVGMIQNRRWRSAL